MDGRTRRLPWKLPPLPRRLPWLLCKRVQSSMKVVEASMKAVEDFMDFSPYFRCNSPIMQGTMSMSVIILEPLRGLFAGRNYIFVACYPPAQGPPRWATQCRLVERRVRANRNPAIPAKGGIRPFVFKRQVQLTGLEIARRRTRRGKAPPRAALKMYCFLHQTVSPKTNTDRNTKVCKPSMQRVC